MSLFYQVLNSSCLCLFAQIEEREEDQRVLNLVGDALRLLGNTLIILGDLRCNLAAPPPRHLYVIRPITHLAHPPLVQAGLPHVPLPVGPQLVKSMCSCRLGLSDYQTEGENSGWSNYLHLWVRDTDSCHLILTEFSALIFVSRC